MKQPRKEKEQISNCFQQSDNKKKYDVSVIVLTFNPLWEKLKLTLDSIIMQVGITVQIIVADDGSSNNLSDSIYDYFSLKAFCDYKLIFSDKNKGTVANLFHACLEADGKYVKAISPGDCLYKSDTLKKWVANLEESGKKWSFGDAAYYQMEDHIPHTIISEPHPQYVRPYIKGNDDECRWFYVVFYDIVLGAAVISEKNVLIDYLNRIIGKIIYVEDMVFRLMMFDGEVGFYYEDIVVVYEYGSGISTGGDDVWAKKISKDIDVSDAEMISHIKDKFQRKMIQTMIYKKKHTSKIAAVFIRGKLKRFFYLKFFKRKTPDIDISNLPYFNIKEN